jgi:hypothetical protein
MGILIVAAGWALLYTETPFRPFRVGKAYSTREKERAVVQRRGRLKVTPFLFGAMLATAGSLALPAVARASGGGHGGGRGGVGPARAQGAAPVRAASVLRAPPLVRRVPRSIAIWPWYGVGYPYDVGPLYPAPASSTPAVYPYPESPQPDSPVDEYPAPPNGWLELRLEPGTAQVYVDGYYAGEVSDFNQPGGRAVEPGPHHVEIRETGYETSAFDVRLLPDQPVTYREDLRPLGGSEPPRSAAGSRATAATTLYVIHGCYAGNVPPSQTALPPGCDPAQVQTLQTGR